MPIEKTVTTKMMHGWSKYGGRRFGMYRRETIWSTTWHCQACGKEQVRDLPHYMIPYADTDREYIQICSKCKNKAISHGVNSHDELIKLVRK